MVRNTDKPKSYEAMTKRERSDLRRAIATQNKRIDRLEKSGLASSSAAYRYLEAQHAAGANWLYMNKKGQIRFRGNISKMSADKIDQLAHEVRGYRQAVTSSVKGTKRTRAKQVESFNKRLEEMGVKESRKSDTIKQIQSSNAIKTMYDSALYKAFQDAFYSESVKFYYMAKETHDKRFEESIEKAVNEMDVNDMSVLLDKHTEYEQAAREYLTKQQVQDLLIEYTFFHDMTPDEFRDRLKSIKNDTKRGGDYLLNVTNYLARGFE